MFCPHCGAQLPDGSAFCGNCGSPLGAANAAAQPPAPSQPAPSAQPAAGQPAGTYPPNVPPQGPVVAGGQGAKRPFHVTRGMTIGVLVVGVVAIVAIVLAVTGVFGGGKRGSAESVADSVESVYNDLLSSDLDSDAWARFSNGLVDLMHDDAVRAGMEQMGYDSEEELGEDLGGALGSAMSYASGALDMMDLSIEVEVGDHMSASEISSMNDNLDYMGLDLEIEDAYELEATMTATLLEDFGTYEAGETQSQNVGTTGLSAVEIDGSWYLWGN